MAGFPDLETAVDSPNRNQPAPDCRPQLGRTAPTSPLPLSGLLGLPPFLKLGGTSALVYQALDQAEARAAEVARAARLSASATSAALRVLAEHGLAERGPGGWRRGVVALADVAESTGAADLQRKRETRYKQDRESWRTRLRTYQGAPQLPVSAWHGWLSLEDGDEYDEMCRWPVLSDDFVRGPPPAEVRESA